MTPYNPLTGQGCCGPRRTAADPRDGTTLWLPLTMFDDPAWTPAYAGDYDTWRRIRCRHDFEYWAATAAVIKHKTTGADSPFLLNGAQRRILEALERQRVVGAPVRLILLKARQCGGSTLVQLYLAWIQCTQRRNWHSLICGHVKDTAALIRGMYTKLLANYPRGLQDIDADGVSAFSLKAFERSTNTRLLAGRGCCVTVASSENPEAMRGNDIALAHLSEVAFWADTRLRSPEAFIRSIAGSVARAPLTVVVLESTANGVGNYFHDEWMRALRGESDKVPVFVAWYDIEANTSPVVDVDALIASLSDYELSIMQRHELTPGQMQWYHDKRREYLTDAMMRADFPSDPDEAFVSTGHGVFDRVHIARLRQSCRPAAMRGELSVMAPSGPGALTVTGFVSDEKGCLEVWREPVEGAARHIDRYVVAVDIGGVSESSDWSVIVVIDRCGEGGRPEVVAQWRGHIDHDLLTWRAAAIAMWYGRALLIVESNSLEAEASEGDHGLFLLSQLADAYPNLYHREAFDCEGGTVTARVGFHTNRATKTMVIDRLRGAVRDCAYIERCEGACDELEVYELDSGRFSAKPGHHDDMLMARAIALHVASGLPPARVVRPPARRIGWLS